MAGIQVIVPVADTSKSSCLTNTSGGQNLTRNGLPWIQCSLHSQGPLHPSFDTKLLFLSLSMCFSHFMCIFIHLPTYTNTHLPSLCDYAENVTMGTEALAVSPGVQAAGMNNFQRFEQACSLSEVLTLKFADDQLSTHNDSQVTVLAKTPR